MRVIYKMSLESSYVVDDMVDWLLKLGDFDPGETLQRVEFN